MRYHRTFGLNAEQLDELEERIEEILPEPWDKGTGRPKSAPELWAGKYKTTGHGSLIISDE